MGRIGGTLSLINYLNFKSRNGTLGRRSECSKLVITKLIRKITLMGKIFGFSISWNRALGISSAKQKFARYTGIPTTKGGLDRKIGSILIKLLFGKK
jgi:hypothetical protein